MSRKYKDAAAKLQQNVYKHLKDMKEVLSSDDEEPYESNLLEGVLQRYTHGGGDAHLLNRTKHLLEDSITGKSGTCLICIGSVKRAHPIWNCGHCFSSFHLPCIQKWANDSISLRNEQNNSLNVVVKAIKIEWCCPKCRFSYKKEEIPKKYYCYCEKLSDPPLHPWLLPHSCGEVCEKRLSQNEHCKHRCLLLCHPGPCPPCPQTVNSACYCEKESKKVRCSSSKWSCGQTCKKTLLCNSHKCENTCHEGDCTPCTYTSLQPCLCGSEKIKRPCNDPVWRCTKVCNKPFSCGYHKCTEICHIGECGPCPNSGLKSCPCGADQRYVECPDVMEACLGTCGKKQEDCDHSCPLKCHKGPCPPCQVLVEKLCQCNTHIKSLPCSKEYKCETKCRGTRACGKHPCSRKCCNGVCPPCEKTCDKPLQCGRHKCTNVCHHGPCYPCPLESKVTCRCKETYITVPCGRERFTKPPKCSFPCKIKYKCGHKTENTHTCHGGDCPPCKAICDKTYQCGHNCKAICHQYVTVTFNPVEKPATPWEIQTPKTKVVNLECPPCEAPVTITCYGAHETSQQPCHLANRYPCGRKCEKPLACGNHTCNLLCHLLESSPSFPTVPYKCEICNEECLIPRPDRCSHKCPKAYCHTGVCPPCRVNRKIFCYCGLTELFMQCLEFQTADEDRLSCQLQCPKNLECGHRCRNLCHPGDCNLDQICTKKTKVYCSCGNIKKEMPCNTAREGKKVDCDSSCEAKKVASQIEKEKAEKRLKEIEEEKNRRELEEYERKMGGKKRKYKEKRVVVNSDDRGILKKYGLFIGSGLVVILAIIYVIFAY